MPQDAMNILLEGVILFELKLRLKKSILHVYIDMSSE